MEKKRYLTLASVMAETFNLYFANFLLFCLPFLIIVFPFQQLQTFVTESFGSDGMPVPLSAISTLMNLFISYAVNFYLTIIILKRYRNDKIDIKESISSVFSRIGPYVIMNLLILLGIILWSLLLIIPGIIYFAMRSVADVILVNEGLGIRASLKRSRLLTKKRRFIIIVSFGILFLIMIMLLLVYYGMLGFTLQGGLEQFTASSELFSGNSVLNIVYSLLTNCIMPLFSILSVVIYMALLKEKEGFETEQLADSFMEDGNE